ncbi:transcriptional regulator [Salmonella enterica subsp. enterica]|uniref:Transcriptional regulator n=1 Tax=Salmonella enterica I TaxID=59201 RepID=A0A379WQW8_SALET|nr:transcriptional regulator [Salmonella enterica subsp. enterica]
MEPKAKTGIVQILKVHWKKRYYAQRSFSSGGLSPDSLRNVFTRSWPRAERIIADALGITPQEIWPSRYGDMQIKNDAIPQIIINVE